MPVLIEDRRGMTSPATDVRLRVGLTYRVDGVLHDYLGPAVAPEAGGLVHAFLRREWRPNTPDQLPVTLVAEDAVQNAVTPSRMSVGGESRLAPN